MDSKKYAPGGSSRSQAPPRPNAPVGRGQTGGTKAQTSASPAPPKRSSGKSPSYSQSRPQPPAEFDRARPPSNVFKPNQLSNKAHSTSGKTNASAPVHQQLPGDARQNNGSHQHVHDQGHVHHNHNRHAGNHGHGNRAVDLETGGAHHHPKMGATTANRAQEQKSESIRVYCLQAFILYLYLVYMIVIIGPLLIPKPTAAGVTVCVLFNTAFVLMTIAFWQCATMDPGEVPSSAKGIPNARFCVKCHNAKPERTHHCSMCGKCVLNMDHHCPWLANCVGFHNRQFFLLILVYGTIAAGFATVHGFVYMFTVAPYVWPRKTEWAELENKAPGMLGFVNVCVMLFFALTLFVVLIGFLRYHISLVCSNNTTIETTFCRGEPPDYDLGSCWLNHQQVFGPRWYLWWCPIWREPLGDGYTWGPALLDLIEKDEHQRLVTDDRYGKQMQQTEMRRAPDQRHR